MNTRNSYFALALIFCLQTALCAQEELIKGQRITIDARTFKANGLKKALQPGSSSVAACPPCIPTAIPNPMPIIPVIQNPKSPAVAFYPNNSAANQLISQPQKADLTFLTGNRAINPRFSGTPPDTMGIIGPKQFIMAINGGLRTFNRQGIRDGLLNEDRENFFNLDGDFSFLLGTADPHIRYDQFTDRFILLCGLTADRNAGGASGLNNGFSIAISDRGVIDENTKWKVVNIFNNSLIPDSTGCPGDQNLFWDFPSLGVDKHALYIGFDLFTDVDYYSSSAIVIQKKSMLTDGPVVMTIFRDIVGIGAPSTFKTATIQGVNNFDCNPEFGYFVSTNHQYLGMLNIWRVINPGSTHPQITSALTLDVPTTGDSALLSAPFKNNFFGPANGLETIDDRLQMAHIRDNQLYTIHNILVDKNGIGGQSGDRKAARWYQIDVTGDTKGRGCKKVHALTQPALVQAGTLWDPAENDPLFYYFGSIMTNKRGDLTVCGTLSNNQTSPSAFYTGRLASDPLGTLRIGATALDRIYAQGTGTYSVNLQAALPSIGQRWGDYSYTSLDPEDEMTMWTIQEVAYNNLENVVVAKLTAPDEKK